jgi:hypothetical protein
MGKEVIRNILYNYSTMENSKTQIKPDKKLTIGYTQTEMVYIDKGNTYINKISEHTNIHVCIYVNVAYRAHNNIQENVTPKTHTTKSFQQPEYKN